MTNPKHTDTSRRGDLVERLRSRVSNMEILMVDPPRPAPDHLCHEAADRIEALEAENERLREVLRNIDAWGDEWAASKARAALGEKQ